MTWVIPVLLDLLNAYWWIAAVFAVSLVAIMSGFAARFVVWLEDTYAMASWVRSQ